MNRPLPLPAGPDQESVWTFPRPAIAQPTSAHLRVVLGGQIIAETRCGVRTIETSHPPTYYFPLADIIPGALRRAAGSIFCERKGAATYYDVIAGGAVRPKAAWAYSTPIASFAIIKDHVAFYAGLMDACFVDGEEVVPQPGGFYGGWITSAVVGPFKGIPGSQGW